MEAALVQGCTLTRAKSILSSNRCQNLTSLDDRIAEFIVDRFPDEGSPVELLCVDHIGTYVVPYPNADPALPDGRQRVVCHRHDLVRTIQTGSGPVIVFTSK